MSEENPGEAKTAPNLSSNVSLIIRFDATPPRHINGRSFCSRAFSIICAATFLTHPITYPQTYPLSAPDEAALPYEGYGARQEAAEALLEQETLNRAEFVALMDSGSVPEGLGEDKPRTTEQVLAQAGIREEAADPAPKQDTENKTEAENTTEKDDLV